MNWTDELCKDVIARMVEVPGRTYGAIAQELAQELGEFIHPEQLRAALRRYNARSNRVKPEIVEAESGFLPHIEKEPRVIEPLVPAVHKPRMVKPLRLRFGAIGDTHNCSKYEDLESLQRLYEIFQYEGVTNVYHTGNYIDGEARFNASDLLVRGMDSQIRYFVENYPKVPGITTHFIAGDDHEGWYVQNNGVEIGEHTEDIARRMGRDDLRYLGYMEADVPIILPDDDTMLMRVMHAGGGSSYALSHTSQKIVDGFDDDDQKPIILLVGHYHKAEYLPNYRGVRIIQTGCFQRQTPFMRKKRLHADIGGWIVDVAIVDDKTTRVSAEFIHFGQRPWKYAGR